jgi:hypothetical protein
MCMCVVRSQGVSMADALQGNWSRYQAVVLHGTHYTYIDGNSTSPDAGTRMCADCAVQAYDYNEYG